MQLTHYNSRFNKHQFPIILVCDEVTNAPNIGSLFRIADAFGVEKLILCGENVQLSRKIKKTSRATEKIVPCQIEANIVNVLTELKKQNYHIIALEITSRSSAIQSHRFSANKPIAVVVGNENEGVSDAALKVSDTILHIDMFGKNSSMNVVQAANIALYEITKQLLKFP